MLWNSTHTSLPPNCLPKKSPNKLFWEDFVYGFFRRRRSAKTGSKRLSGMRWRSFLILWKLPKNHYGKCTFAGFLPQSVRELRPIKCSLVTFVADAVVTETTSSAAVPALHIWQKKSNVLPEQKLERKQLKIEIQLLLITWKISSIVYSSIFYILQSSSVGAFAR